jgi:hypothetical protein
MKSLSFWASKNIWSARVFLVFSYLFLIGMVFIVTDIISETGIVLPGFLFPLSIFFYLVAAAAYPSKRGSRYRNYFFRKSCDFTLVVCSLLMIMCTLSVNSKTSVSTISVASAANGDPTVKTKKEKKQIKKEQIKKIRALYKELKAAYKNGPKGTKALLVVLSSIVAAGLLLLVLGLSCSLSCSGQGGAAVLLGILGTGLVIFLLVLAIRGINKKYNPLIKESKKPDTQEK